MVAIVVSAMSVMLLWMLIGLPGTSSDWSQLALASGLAYGCIALGAVRSVRAVGGIDFFHPLIFPLIYVSTSFLVPVWVTFWLDSPVGSFARDTPLANNTPVLLLLGVLGFALGAAVPWKTKPSSKEDRESGRIQRVAGAVLVSGRVLALFALALAIRELYLGGVAVRALNQTTYTLDDSISVLTKLSSIATAVVLVGAHSALQSPKLLSRIDWAFILSILIATGLRGDRNAAISVILVLAFTAARHGGSLKPVIGGFVAAVTFMVVVLRYRNSVRGVEAGDGIMEILLGDLAPAGFSTSAVAAVVPEIYPYEWGSTIVAALVRQLPGPVANWLFGPPTDTGSSKFREIIGYSNPNGGVGFSLPAEGYLNFGPAGIVILCAVVGGFCAWAYARSEVRSTRPRAHLYTVVIAVLPFALRTDLLGFTKSILYTFIIVAVVFSFAVAVSPQESRPRRTSNKKMPVTPFTGHTHLGRFRTGHGADYPHQDRGGCDAAGHEADTQ